MNQNLYWLDTVEEARPVGTNITSTMYRLFANPIDLGVNMSTDLSWNQQSPSLCMNTYATLSFVGRHLVCGSFEERKLLYTCFILF